MIQENFKFYKPCRLLQPYVRYYWALKSGQLPATLTFPIGCPQLIFHKKAPLYVPELGVFQSNVTVSGQVNYPSHLCSDGDTEMLVIVFKPYGMKPFLKLPVFLLHNQEVSGYDLGNKMLDTLAEQIFNCANTDLCIRLIESWLSLQIAGMQDAKVAYDLKRISAAMQQLFVTPQTPVTELASAACLSKKQFERLFSDVVGANPKEYARITRFQKALKLLQNDPEGNNQAQLAYQCGYADQSHLIREFKQFSGHTPLSLLSICKPYSDLFTNPV